MAYDAPTVAQFKARFPRFAAVADAMVTEALDEAGGRVDTTWLEKDFQLARMLYAAHVLTLDGMGTGTESAVAAKGMGEFKTIRSGGLALERFGPERGATTTLLESTSYGRRWMALAILNHGGPIWVDAGLPAA